MALRDDIIDEITDTWDAISNADQEDGGDYLAGRLIAREATIEGLFPDHLTDPTDAADYLEAMREAFGASVAELFESNNFQEAFAGGIADGIIYAITAATPGSGVAEAIDDRVAALMQDSSTIAWTYNDGANQLSAAVVQAGIDHGSIGGLSDDDHTQYHTDARAVTWLGTRSTSDLAEGSNLYFTNERAQDAVGGILTDSGTITWTYDDAGNTISAAVAASFFNGFANPSASIGLSAVNGSAVTAMRSDAAPALDVGIIPTWTGAHTFSALTTHNSGITLGTAQVFQGGATSAGHAFGPISTSTFLNVSPTNFIFNGTSQIASVSGVQSPTDPGASFQIRGLRVGQTTVNTPATGSITSISSGFFTPPTIVGGGATITRTATVFINGAPSATVTDDNYALYSSGGRNRFVGAVQMDSTLNIGTNDGLETGLFDITRNDAAAMVNAFTLYQGATPGPVLRFKHSRGTMATPIAIQSTNELGSIEWHGMSIDAGNTFNRTARMYVMAQEAFTSTTLGTGIYFQATAPTSSTLQAVGFWGAFSTTSPYLVISPSTSVVPAAGDLIYATTTTSGQVNRGIMRNSNSGSGSAARWYAEVTAATAGASDPGFVAGLGADGATAAIGLSIDNSVSGDPGVLHYSTVAGTNNIFTFTATTLAVNSAITTTLANTTDATSITTGSWQTLGGAGITKALWVGGLVNIAGVLTADGGIALNAGDNIAIATSTGTKIATATNQLLGFWNATPVAQYATTATVTGYTANVTVNFVYDASTFTGNTGATAYTVGDIVRALKLCGIMAA